MEDKDGYSPTWITDNFPLEYLECQYFEICSAFNQEKCFYGTTCPYYLKLKTSEDGKESAISIREIHRNSVEDFVAEACMKNQIKLILDEMNGKGGEPERE